MSEIFSAFVIYSTFVTIKFVSRTWTVDFLSRTFCLVRLPDRLVYYRATAQISLLHERPHSVAT